MTRDARNNLILAALIVSAAAHVGTMFWVKPKVMTHVTAGITRLTHRGPSRITKAEVKPDPVPIAVLRDEAPQKGAPAPSETMAILPSDETALPSAPVQAASPTTAMPEVLSLDSPDTTTPKFDAAVDNASLPNVESKMSFETPRMTEVVEPYKGLDMPDNLPVSPVFEAPVFAPIGGVEERVAAARIEKPQKAEPKPEFKPVEEVMPQVDEKIVTQEKAAVRELVNSERALDMHGVADVALATCVADGYTYFKATVSPKPRLPNVPKDVVVLIDASGSIGHDRLASCRKATREILRTAMNSGDRFNLVAFRDKFAYCFKAWQPCEAASYAAGEKWMARLAAHGRTDVFSTISSVLTLPREPTRPLIALVVTDGEANTGVSETADILAQFTRLNDGLVSVYMYGVKSSANRELIDVLTHGNRGESLIFDGWRWNAGEGIGSFSERFRDPLVTDLRILFPTTCPAEAYPALLKNLYRNNTLELVGRVQGAPREIVFSLRGIAGSLAYEGLFRLKTKTALPDATLPDAWLAERKLDAKLSRK